jgi:hypothetical protein
MRFFFVVVILFSAVVTCTVEAAPPACGQEGQPPCGWAEATLLRQQSGLCATGEIFDLIDGGTCWKCPDGYGRTIFPVNGDSACEKVSTTRFSRAQERDKGTGWFGTDCPSGQFWDIVDGKCHSCPGGYSMQVLEHVHAETKCAQSVPASFSKATKIGLVCGGNIWDPQSGGQCWSCPEGYTRTIAPVASKYACEYARSTFRSSGCEGTLRPIRGTCVRTGVCGQEGQRPCEIDEQSAAHMRTSCRENLREDFKTNKCVALRPGETPFLGGVASLAGFWGATLQGHCKNLLGNIDWTPTDDFGGGARCTKDATIGFACAFLRDVAAGYTDMAGTAADLPQTIAGLAEQMNAASLKTPCAELAERFSKATRYSKATGAVLQVECPAGQFWDPDGYCYSCPADYTRTLFPVTHEKACTDRVGGNLQRLGCGAIQGVMASTTGPIKCTIEQLENGSILEKPLDMAHADHAVCLATGELGFQVVKGTMEIGKMLAGDPMAILSTIGKVKASVSGGSELKRLIECKSKLQ